MLELSTRRLDCGRKPDPGRLRQVEECSGRTTVREYQCGLAPADVGPVDLVVTRLHRGGRRTWFACPGCRRRAGVLHRPDPGDPWLCRRCHGLTYRSAQQAHRDELLWIAFRHIDRHLEKNNGWGDVETLFDGLDNGRAMAVCRAILYIDIGSRALRRSAGGPS